MRILILIIFYLCVSFPLMAQYPPAAGQPGSTAIAADSNVFVAWANGCTVQRGLMDISNSSLGFVSYGTETAALDIADNSVVSLGDSGIATLTFQYPIVNGNGFDFAVFENGMMDTYLELAFVEVSSDGIHFVRFPSVSLTQDTLQIGGFGLLDCTLLNNLAGKYRVSFGTPFDLEEIRDSAGIDVGNITHVRLVDVVGCIQPAYASRDASGHVINDPWSTAFASGGFDLDAVGVIHNTQNPGGLEDINIIGFSVYPNPSSNGVFTLTSEAELERVTLFDISGKEIFDDKVYGKKAELNLSVSQGIYLMRIQRQDVPAVFCKLIVTS